ncbi:MAG: hypothetical protein ACQEVA_13360 [Myxococcota bacterium]
MSSHPRAYITRVTLCCATALLLTGCAAVKGMLKPMVCDCADASATANTCPSQPDEEIGDESVMTVAQSEVAASTDSARASAEAEPQESATPNKRTLERNEEPERDPLELVEPDIASALIASDDEEALSKLHATYPVPESLPESAVLLKANFDADEGQELAVVEPGRRIQIFDESQRLADLKFSTSTAQTSPKKVKRSGTSAVKIVRDGTAQILTHWTEKSEDGGVIYKVGVFKLIESYIGTAFEAELARKPTDSKAFVSSGTYEFLRGGDHAFIRWIPTTDEGDFDASEATVYKWNKWEGVYRIPAPPPTAPENQKLQTQRDVSRTTSLAVK